MGVLMSGQYCDLISDIIANKFTKINFNNIRSQFDNRL